MIRAMEIENSGFMNSERGLWMNQLRGNKDMKGGQLKIKDKYS